MRRWSILIPAISLSSLALTACGGATSDKQQITELIKSYGKEPKKLCTTYATADMLRLQFGSKANCLTAASSFGAADPKVKVDRVTITGKTAKAIRTSESPPGVGQKSTIHLVKQGGSWKVSQVTPGAS